jgi:hypothetical protein
MFACPAHSGKSFFVHFPEKLRDRMPRGIGFGEAAPIGNLLKEFLPYHIRNYRMCQMLRPDPSFLYVFFGLKPPFSSAKIRL